MVSKPQVDTPSPSAVLLGSRDVIAQVLEDKASPLPWIHDKRGILPSTLES